MASVFLVMVVEDNNAVLLGVFATTELAEQWLVGHPYGHAYVEEWLLNEDHVEHFRRLQKPAEETP